MEFVIYSLDWDMLFWGQNFYLFEDPENFYWEEFYSGIIKNFSFNSETNYYSVHIDKAKMRAAIGTPEGEPLTFYIETDGRDTLACLHPRQYYDYDGVEAVPIGRTDISIPLWQKNTTYVYQGQTTLEATTTFKASIPYEASFNVYSAAFMNYTLPKFAVSWSSETSPVYPYEVTWLYAFLWSPDVKNQNAYIIPNNVILTHPDSQGTVLHSNVQLIIAHNGKIGEAYPYIDITSSFGFSGALDSTDYEGGHTYLDYNIGAMPANMDGDSYTRTFNLVNGTNFTYSTWTPWPNEQNYNETAILTQSPPRNVSGSMHFSPLPEV